MQNVLALFPKCSLSQEQVHSHGADTVRCLCAEIGASSFTHRHQSSGTGLG